MLSILISVIALGFIIAFHEFGHFIAAKACGVSVLEFAIGFGPKLIAGRIGETDYSLRIIPFGGACVMLGEDQEALPDGGTGEIQVDTRIFPRESQFSAKPSWQRFIIVAAGPVFNFILAFLMALIIISHYGYDRSTILAVDPGFPLALAGVEEGDTITGFGTVSRRSGTPNIKKIETARDIELFLLEYEDEVDGGEPIAVRYLDASDSKIEKTAVVNAIYDEETGSWRLGFTYSYAYLPADGIADTVYYAWYDVKYCIKSAILSLKLIFSGQVGADEVMGPVGIVAVMDETVDQAADYGVTAAAMSLLEFMILISGSLGAMNLLPIPALDGGRLLFIFIEMLTGRAVPARLEGMVHFVGFVLLFALMILIMFHDAARLIIG